MQSSGTSEVDQQPIAKQRLRMAAMNSQTAVNSVKDTIKDEKLNLAVQACSKESK
jgi:hypothetical protein